jgi:hypothetical protein
MTITKKDIKCELASFAEAVRAESVFDLSMNIEIGRFFRLKFENDEIDTQKLCNLIYKTV